MADVKQRDNASSLAALLGRAAPAAVAAPAPSLEGAQESDPRPVARTTEGARGVRAWSLWLAGPAGRLATAVAFLSLLAVAELLTAFGDPRFGVGLHIFLLGVVLFAGVAQSEPRAHAYYLVLAFGPLIRIISTGMPLLAFPQVLWYLLTSVPLFATAYVIMRLLDLSPGAIGLRLPERRYLILEPLVVLSGMGLGVVEWFILRPPLLVQTNSAVILFGAGLILLVGTGLMEELVFRGMIQYAASRYFGTVPGMLFSATIFAVLHIGHLSAPDIVFVALVGFYFSVVVRYTRSLLGVTLSHGTINTMLFVVVPLVAMHHA